MQTFVKCSVERNLLAADCPRPRSRSQVVQEEGAADRRPVKMLGVQELELSSAGEGFVDKRVDRELGPRAEGGG